MAAEIYNSIPNDHGIFVLLIFPHCCHFVLQNVSYVELTVLYLLLRNLARSTDKATVKNFVALLYRCPRTQRQAET